MVTSHKDSGGLATSMRTEVKKVLLNPKPFTSNPKDLRYTKQHSTTLYHTTKVEPRWLHAL